MNLFLKNILLFVLGSAILTLGIYCIVDYNYKNQIPTNPVDTIFIWGDSQTFQGIDLNYLKKITGQRILSAARHGAGPYDFLRFSESVPSNSQVIISISALAQMRRIEKDNNKSGITFSALSVLKENGYSLKDLVSVIKRKLSSTHKCETFVL